MLLIVKVSPWQIVLVEITVTIGFGTIVIVFSDTAFIPQAAWPVAVKVKVTVPVCPRAGIYIGVSVFIVDTSIAPGPVAVQVTVVKLLAVASPADKV